MIFWCEHCKDIVPSTIDPKDKDGTHYSHLDKILAIEASTFVYEVERMVSALKRQNNRGLHFKILKQ